MITSFFVYSMVYLEQSQTSPMEPFLQKELTEVFCTKVLS